MNFTYNFSNLDKNFDRIMLKELATLDQKEMKYSWTLASWLECQESIGTTFYVGMVLNANVIVGFSLWQWIDLEQAELLKFVLAKDFQGSGLAETFWGKNVDKIKAENQKKVILEVATKNLRAIAFYKKMSFKTLTIRKGFYSDNSDALCMFLVF